MRDRAMDRDSGRWRWRHCWRPAPCGAAGAGAVAARKGTPKVGASAADFTLRALDGTTVQLSRRWRRETRSCSSCCAAGPAISARSARASSATIWRTRRGSRRFEHACSSFTGPGEGLRERTEAFAASERCPRPSASCSIPTMPTRMPTGCAGTHRRDRLPVGVVVDANGVVTFAQTSDTWRQGHGGYRADVLARMSQAGRVR